MAKRVSVIGDAVSSEFFFPLWHQYYSQLFGAKSIFLVTYKDQAPLFQNFELGGLWEIPAQYNDILRASAISAMVTTLLTVSDIVIRVDTDEFLVPDPSHSADLRDYVAKLSKPYVTGRGMNIIQHPDEPPIDLSSPILIRQRAYAQPVGPLNKTCLTSVPFKWTPGFHFGSHFPVFDSLFLFHMKHADIGMQMDLRAWMTSMTPGNLVLQEYNKPDLDRIKAHQVNSFGLPVVTGDSSVYREDFCERFLKTFEYVPAQGYYHGQNVYDPNIVKIPERFENLI